MVRNLCVAEKYQKDGVEKIKWNIIGVIFTSGEKEYVKLFHMPGVLINVFEPRPKGEAPKDEGWKE